MGHLKLSAPHKLYIKLSYINNCIKANVQLTPQNMLPSYEHAFQGRIESINFNKKYPYPKQTCTIFHGDLKVRAVVENKMSSGQYENYIPCQRRSHGHASVFNY